MSAPYPGEDGDRSLRGAYLLRGFLSSGVFDAPALLRVLDPEGLTATLEAARPTLTVVKEQAA